MSDRCNPRRHLGRLFAVYDFAQGRAKENLLGEYRAAGLSAPRVRRHEDEILEKAVLRVQLSARDVADRCGADKETAVRYIRALVERGWLIPEPGNKGGTKVTLDFTRSNPHGVPAIRISGSHAGRAVWYRVLTHAQWLTARPGRCCP